jgi:hypothetical protein
MTWDIPAPARAPQGEGTMGIIFTIHGPLADTLRQLAVQRGMSVEALGQEVIAAGLIAVAPEAECDAEVLDLGTLALPSAHPLRLYSPILAQGAIPQYTLEVLLMPMSGESDAD